MITLIILYYLYLFFVALFTLYSLFNVYHLLRFGFASLTNILIIIIYMMAAGLLLAFSFYQLSFIDWSTPIFNWNNIFNLNLSPGI